MIALYPYQLAAVAEARRRAAAGVRRLCIVAPTGAGKSVIAAHVAASAATKGSRCLFLAHRLELVEQLSGKLDLAGLDHGIIQGAHERTRPGLPVQVASVPTLARRGVLPGADLVVVDECHHTPSASFRRIVESYPEATLLGFTATPYRLDGRGLKDFFDEAVHVAHLDELITAGFLVPPIVLAPSEPDVTMVRRTGGDFNARELAAVVDRPKLIGDIVATWLSRAAGRTTVVFATSIEHSRHIVSAFLEAGVPAEHLDAETPAEERAAILVRAASGETAVLSNCAILTEGWDLPRISCVVQARPTQSRALYRQMVGRGLRTWETKADCLVLDHAGNVFRHGLPTERDTQGLAGVKRRDASQAPSVRQCPLCYACAPSAATACPGCAQPFPVRRRPLIATKGGELSEVTTWKEYAGPDRRAELLAKWDRIATERAYKAGYASAIYRSTFGTWPDEATWAKARRMNGDHGHRQLAVG